MRHLEERGFKCMRSSGSHTPLDLLAGDGVRVYAIQVKYGKTRQKVDLDELREWAKMFKAVPYVATKRPYRDWVMEPAMEVDG